MANEQLKQVESSPDLLEICDTIRRQTIDKACDWLQKEVLDDYAGVVWEDLIADFRKAMEE